MRGLLLLALLGGCGSEVSVPSQEPSPPAAPAAPPKVAALPEVTLSPARRVVQSPAAVPATERMLAARAILVRVVEAHGRAGDNPWAVSHALVALGPETVLADGVPAVDALYERYAEAVPFEGETGVRFPKSVGAIRVEPHTDLLLKAFSEIGVPPDHPVVVKGAPADVAHHYRTSLARTWVDGESLWTTSWNDTPWTLQALAAWAPEDLAWTADGHPMTLDVLTSAVVDHLDRDTAFLRDAIASGTTVQKRGQGIFAYTCGGAHLLQGAAYAVARGFGAEGDRARIEAQVPVLFYRLPFELDLVDQAVTQHPKYALQLMDQRLKFLGHFLESGHKLAAMGFYAPDAAQTEALGQGLEELVHTVESLEADGTFGHLDAIRAQNEQLYLDFVGDAAHAIRGLDLATGAGSIRL